MFILQQISNIWNKLSNNGLVEGLAENEIQKIRILNQAAGTLLVFLVFVFFQLGEDREYYSTRWF